MKTLTVTLCGTILAAAILTTTLAAGPAQAATNHPACADRATLLGQLARLYSEAPVNMGLTNVGSVLELLTSTEGTWTILVTTPDGITCMAAAGANWEVKPKTATFTPSGEIVH